MKLTATRTLRLSDAHRLPNFVPGVGNVTSPIDQVTRKWVCPRLRNGEPYRSDS